MINSRTTPLLLLILTLLGYGSSAQSPWCGIGTHTHSVQSQESSLQFEQYYRSQLKSINIAQKRNSKYIIPLVFHVIHQGGTENVKDADIIGLVKQINEDFALENDDTTQIQAPFKKVAANCEIEFRLAKINEDGNCTNGITRTFSSFTEGVRDFGGNNVKSLIRWNRNKYLNIWVVKSILSNGEGITLGYAYYPGTGGNNDGIVIRSDQMNSNTLTHEIGHYLNLKHTFDDGCFGGDNVDDTPPTAKANFRCPKGRNSCSNDSPDLIDQIENYMDYSDCSAMFTMGQKIRMQSAIDLYRPQLVSEANLINTGVKGNEIVTNPKADFSAEKRILCSGNDLQLFYTGCDLGTNSTIEWTIDGPQKFTSNDENPLINFDSAGDYNVKLSVTNTKGADVKTRTKFIKVLSSESISTAPYAQGINGSELPNDIMFTGMPEEFVWQLSDKGRDGSACIFIPNFGKGRPSYKASFVMPAINIETINDQNLRYDLSYASINDESNDQLNVYVSIDCGASWRLISSETSRRIETTFDRPYAYVPTEDKHWQEKTLDLSRYSKYDLLVKFEFISKNGNNIYIDNIKIGTTELGILNTSKSGNFSVYPNPANQNSSITFKVTPSSQNGKIKISDLSGRVIRSFEITDHLYTFETKALNSGMYFVSFELNGLVVTKPLIIK